MQCSDMQWVKDSNVSYLILDTLLHYALYFWIQGHATRVWCWQGLSERERRGAVQRLLNLRNINQPTPIFPRWNVFTEWANMHPENETRQSGVQSHVLHGTSVSSCHLSGKRRALCSEEGMEQVFYEYHIIPTAPYCCEQKAGEEHQVESCR